MDRHIIASDCSLLKALDMLNALSGGVMTLFVTGADGTMVGTLTDGDVRRGLLKGAQLTDPVEHVMKRCGEHPRHQTMRSETHTPP